MSTFEKKTIADWEAQAKKEKKTDDLTNFKWESPEGITVKASLHCCRYRRL